MTSVLTLPLEPTPNDGLPTATSDEQVATETLIRSLLDGLRNDFRDDSDTSSSSHASPPSSLVLDTSLHSRWLKGMMTAHLPAPYVSLDASRPWILYWCAHSLALMGYELDKETKQRARETIKSFWNKETGGFGGGPGQMAHLAPTYASVSALCYLIDEEDEDAIQDAWGWIDRQALHTWMLTLKQPDGSFVMHAGGEVDVRGCYCALTTAVLLNILTPDLAAGTAEFIASCQTWEGGLASASHPVASTSASPMVDESGMAPPLGEAHGGYTYCALASYFALTASEALQLPAPSNTQQTRKRGLNVRALLRWAAHMQGLPIEAGCFRGRSNKLVDGCYSWWCGGLFTLIQALLPPSGGESEEDAPDLYDRIALQEFVLIAAQAPSGGLRDKPGKGADAYHSCYNLSGLASAQHAYAYSPSSSSTSWTPFETSSSIADVKGSEETDEQADQRRREIYLSALAWRPRDERKIVVGDKERNELKENHPVYNLVIQDMEKMLRWSYGQASSTGQESGIVEL